IKLKKSRNDLEEHGKNLEKMVAERTAKLEEEYKKSEEQRIATLNILQDIDEVNENLMRQIAEKKQLQDQLLHAGKMEAVGTLAGGIAHDFNNLLQAIMGYTQMLLLGKKKKDPDFDKLTQIESSARRAGELTQQLLTFSRKVESELRPVNLNQGVKQVKKLLKRTIPRMIDIELHLEENIKIINADPAQIEQVLMNLGVNARDAMPDGGKIIVETENVILDEEYCKTHLGAVPGEHVLLSFSDTGHGMDKETVEHIFEPFYTTKETGKGTGLGMAMVYGIMKSHHGYIMCYSEPGEGATFKIYFPAIEESVVSNGLSVDREEEMQGENETILLVDDEGAILDMGRNMLERFGYTAIMAESGEKAIEIYKAQKERIDLVILDLGMPGMGGHKCLKELLKIDPRIKVIVASGYPKIGKVKETVESGASGFIGKPYQIADMLKKVREILDN
ncbi:MAG: response regulator, partial [Thermodesulfobacteriota bacterium]|nr:response regulator [Thermodesulfobacteriota bacterium]